jgi:hypothetical protein
MYHNIAVLPATNNLHWTKYFFISWLTVIGRNFSPLTHKSLWSVHKILPLMMIFRQISSLWIFDTNFARVFHPPAWSVHVIFLDVIMLIVDVSSTNHEASHYAVFFSSPWFPHSQAQTHSSAPRSRTSSVYTRPFEWQIKFCTHTKRKESKIPIPYFQFSAFIFQMDRQTFLKPAVTSIPQFNVLLI